MVMVVMVVMVVVVMMMMLAHDQRPRGDEQAQGDTALKLIVILTKKAVVTLHKHHDLLVFEFCFCHLEQWNKVMSLI